MVLAAIAVVAMLATRWTGTWALALWCVAWTAAAGAGLAGMLHAWRMDRAGRGRWGWFVAAAASWLVGQLGWDYYAVAGPAPLPSVADIGWWGFAALVIAGLLRPLRGRGTARLVGFVEAIPVAAPAMALTFAWLWSTPRPRRCRPPPACPRSSTRWSTSPPRC